MSKTKDVEVMEPTRVELFGEEVELWEYQDFTPVQQIRGTEILNRMIDGEDGYGHTEAALELGLLLTHSPQFKKPVTLEAFRKMFRTPRTSDERAEVRKFNQELTEQVINAGKAVMDMITSHWKNRVVKSEEAADEGKDGKAKNG